MLETELLFAFREMALWRSAQLILGKRLRGVSSNMRAISTEARAEEMANPLFVTPDAVAKDDAAMFGSSIRDQTNFFVKEVKLVLLLLSE